MPLNTALLAILACPKCKGPLTVLPRQDGLLCAPCALVYPVRDEIPVMLPDEAVSRDKWTGSLPD